MNSKHKSRDRSGRKSRGQTMVEFALMAPIVLLVIYGIVELGRYMQAYLTVQYASREGARYAVTGASTTGIVADRPQSIVDKARRATAGLRIFESIDTPAAQPDSDTANYLDVELSPSNGSTYYSEVTVIVTYNFEPLLPVSLVTPGGRITLLPSILQVQGRTTMINERIDKVTPVQETTWTPSATATSGPSPTITPDTTSTAAPSATEAPASSTPTLTLTPSVTLTPTQTNTPGAACLIALNGTPEIGVGSGSKTIKFVVINNDSVNVTITTVVITWDIGGAQIEEVKIPDKVWKHDGSAGSPSGRQNSGTTLDIDDETINAGNILDDIELNFDSDMTGASGSMTFNTSAGTQCSLGFSVATLTPTTTLTPTQTNTPGGPCLIQLNSVPIIGAGKSNNQIKFIVINNDTSSVTITSVVATWDISGAQIKEVKMPAKVWKQDGSAGSPTGLQNSGTTLDIDDVTVNAGAEINDIELHFDSVDVTGASGTLTFNTSLGGQCSVNFGTGTATPTSSPTQTPSATLTPTPTATNTTGPTQTATATGTSCDVTVAAPTYSGKDAHVRHNLTNNSGTENLTITSIFLTWDSNYDKFKRVKFENNTIWDGTDISCCSTTINSDWEAASRVLYFGTTKEIKYEFSGKGQKNPISFTITFDTGCTASYP